MTHRVVLRTSKETRTLCFDDKEIAMGVYNTIAAALDIPRGETFELCVEQPVEWESFCGMTRIKDE